jgi:surface antigen
VAACKDELQSQLASAADPAIRAMCERQFGGAAAGGARGRMPTANQRLCDQLGLGVTQAGTALMGGILAQFLSPRERDQAGQSTQRVLDAPARPGTRDNWSSPDTPGNRGETELVRVDQGGNCRTVREIAYVRGQEVSQQSQFCRTASGGWERVT